ncbi:MAG: Rhs element Vgr protein [Bacteroidetes bacterium]|nr:MAG: Rhs element Vgr protein [Bacteroidota bacterium]
MQQSEELTGHKNLTLPNFKILASGIDLTAKYSVASCMVSQQVNRIPSARVILHDGDTSTQDFELSGEDFTLPGTEIEIKAGYPDSENPLNEEVTIFKGIIIKHAIKSSLHGNSMLVLELRHKAVEMTGIRKNKYFTEKSPDNVNLNEIVSTYGITLVAGTMKEQPGMVQYYSTDWDFLVSRAEANGMIVICDGFDSVPSIYVKKGADGSNFASSIVPRPSQKSETLSYGANIVNLELESDARDSFGKILAKTPDTTDPTTPKEASTDNPDKTSTDGDFAFSNLGDKLKYSEYLLQAPAPLTPDELKVWSENMAMRSFMNQVRGNIRVYGVNTIRPGDSVKLKGVGKRFEGTVFVSGVVHSYENESTWITDLTIGLDREPFYEKYPGIVDKPAAGLLPSINGLHAGIVTKIVEDPGNEFRIKVRIPLIDKAKEGVWARMARPDAGLERGMIFRPYVGDEVLLGFVNDDPRSPVILGMLHSSTNTPPADFNSDSDDKNYIRGFFTKEKIKFLFDDEKKIVTLETPGKNSIVIDDDKKSITLKDQNNNEIVMDDKGITIKSGKDVIVDASTGKFEVKAKEVKISATTSLEAKGSSKAEFGSNGTTAVSGSQISIG